MGSPSTDRISLPIDPHLPAILSALESSSALILKSSPGSGKTTRVPAALLQASFAKDKEIWVLEPRRLAAKWAAHRVAEELGETPGQQALSGEPVDAGFAHAIQGPSGRAFPRKIE